MESAKKRATVVGGSLTGLAAGSLLQKIGWEVDIFERSPQNLSDRGAGIVMQDETLELLRLCGARDDNDVGVTLTYRKYLNANGSVASSERMPQLRTSWGLLYAWFKRGFPAKNYHLCHEFEGRHGNRSRSPCRRRRLPVEHPRSTLPEIQPKYAGYVAWRGVVPEGELSADVLKVFDDNFTFQDASKSHSVLLDPQRNGRYGRWATQAELGLVLESH
jgi:FAD binding domain